MKVILTGGAGFIGSCILWKLNKEGYDKIIVVDEMNSSLKEKNVEGKKFLDFIDKNDFINKVGKFSDYNLVIHMGADSSTMGTDINHYMKVNYEYSKTLAEFSIEKNMRFLYASSAATYGNGELGFSDNDKTTPKLKPLNFYGQSKQKFDMWVLENSLQNRFAGFKFFNVYGPNEYHKGNMRSLICKKFDSVVKDKQISLFKSYKQGFKDGEQKRDFVYVKDAINAVYFFIENPSKSGIYNIGTGKAHSWNDLSEAIFNAIDIPVQINYVEMPEILKDKYQYFTEAEIGKLEKAGFKEGFMSLKDAIKDYSEYLKNKSHL